MRVLPPQLAALSLCPRLLSVVLSAYAGVFGVVIWVLASCSRLGGLVGVWFLVGGCDWGFVGGSQAP